ncbi:hypothetical protein EV384_0329 [Micromonospora kangleipakensis]|uniref:Uncharacterized protein n=1 Tax=Micromonospora kangleipakensis TaxID=1077942 RepID=A0A4Q8B3B2_9ACTN|nr:hypothetical protein EV384_0329 [Micromonospora kangleipakensis]
MAEVLAVGEAGCHECSARDDFVWEDVAHEGCRLPQHQGEHAPDFIGP